MQRRGRSRQVSSVALARLASEERRQSLQDQIQAAYADDHIRLAKVLLLRFNGVLVADDTDPRIDQVRDEDFDVCFAPSGPLTLSDADKRAVQESQRRHRQSWHASQRALRLRAREKLWADEKTRLHDEKCRALQRRVQDADQLRSRPAENPRATKPRPDPVSAKQDCDPFQYAFMPPSSCRSSAKKASPRAPSQSRSVSFKEVLAAMNGKLFPLDPSERADDARRIVGLPISSAGTASHKRRTSARADLLDSLLQVVEWQEGERRKAKGKDVDRSQPPPSSPLHPPTAVLPVPSSFSAASVSCSVPPSRSSSWLSFGSWRSTATDITTPDSPVLCSPVSQLCLLPDGPRDFHPRCSFVRITLEESPLCPPDVTPAPPRDGQSSVTSVGPCVERFPSPGMRETLVGRVTRSVATIVEAAKSLQSAYIAATVFAAGPPYRVGDSLPQHLQPSRYQRMMIRREGYRALARDVRKFTDTMTPISQVQTREPVHFIPLVSPPSATAAPPRPPAPRDVILFPSPLRPRTPPAALAYRMRPIANPAVLRLRALQNIMCARGKEWEGRARDGGLGCGKERMLGIAFEGRGRSGLGCEVRFVVA